MHDPGENSKYETQENKSRRNPQILKHDGPVKCMETKIYIIIYINKSAFWIGLILITIDRKWAYILTLPNSKN